MPFSNLSQNSPVKARSVPLSCVTRYCSAVSVARMVSAAGFYEPPGSMRSQEKSSISARGMWQ